MERLGTEPNVWKWSGLQSFKAFVRHLETESYFQQDGLIASGALLKYEDEISASVLCRPDSA